MNKAIVDYTSPALCTPVTPFPPIGDAAYQHTRGGRSHRHRQHAQKFGKDRVCGFGDILADKQTDTQTDILITILGSRFRARSNQWIGLVYDDNMSTIHKKQYVLNIASFWYQYLTNGWWSLLVSCRIVLEIEVNNSRAQTLRIQHNTQHTDVVF